MTTDRPARTVTGKLRSLRRLRASSAGCPTWQVHVDSFGYETAPNVSFAWELTGNEHGVWTFTLDNRDRLGGRLGKATGC